MAYTDHQTSAAPLVARCAVLTVSDTRTADTDTSGRRTRELLVEHGHVIARSDIVADEPQNISTLLEKLLSDCSIDAIISNGGTGISPRDRTIDVIQSKLELTLPGFGELFRMLSWEQIGSGALLSRAVGGTARGKAVFALPGSTKAVELGMTKLILPELRHVLHELRKSQ